MYFIQFTSFLIINFSLKIGNISMLNAVVFLGLFTRVVKVASDVIPVSNQLIYRGLMQRDMAKVYHRSFFRVT